MGKIPSLGMAAFRNSYNFAKLSTTGNGLKFQQRFAMIGVPVLFDVSYPQPGYPQAIR